MSPNPPRSLRRRCSFCSKSVNIFPRSLPVVYNKTADANLDHQTSVFSCPRAKFSCPRQSDLGFFLPWPGIFVFWQLHADQSKVERNTDRKMARLHSFPLWYVMSLNEISTSMSEISSYYQLLYKIHSKVRHVKSNACIKNKCVNILVYSLKFRV